MKPRQIISTLSLSALLLGGSFLMAQPSDAEKRWDAPPPPEKRAQRDDRPDRGPQHRGERGMEGEGGPGFDRPPFNDGPGGWRGEPEGMPGQILRRLQKARMEMMRLSRGEEELARQEREIEKLRESGADAARVERRERILALRRELLTLERDEFAARTQEESSQALKKLEQVREERAEDLEEFPQRAEMLDRLEERLKAINVASGKGFDALQEEVENAPGPWGPDGGERAERLRREMNDLDARLRNLREEMDRLGEEPGMPEDGMMPPPPPRRRGNPD